MINCSRKTTCEYDYGTCLIIDAQCQGFCLWVGTAQNGSCVRGSGGNRSCRSNINSITCRNDGCVWSNNACRNPSSPSIFKCSDYNRTNRNKCVNKGCFWDGNTRTCNANIITRSCRRFTTGSDCFSAGCDWRYGVCQLPSTSFKCSDYDRTNSNTCVGNGCFWDSMTSTCNANIINRSNPTPSRSGDSNCTGPNSNQCKFMTEFCYTKGDCRYVLVSYCLLCTKYQLIPYFTNNTLSSYLFTSSANASGKCQVKPRTYADCANSGKFNTYPTSAGNACGSNHFYASECAAAQEGKNIPFPNKDEVAEEVEREESDSVFEEE